MTPWGGEFHITGAAFQGLAFGWAARPTVSISYVKPRKTCNNSKAGLVYTKMFRFADVPFSLSGMTRIAGRRVFLRAPAMDDWAEWAELRARSRAFLTPWEPTWPEDSLGRDHYRRRLRQQAREWRSGEAYSLFVFTNEGRRLAGGINLSNVRRGVAQAASVGYWMGQPYAGQGLMTDALRATLPFVFDDLRLHRLEAACLPHNEPSKGVLARAGFTEVGKTQ